MSTIWQPNPDHEDGTPNPQRLAYESEADILGYGGAAGGGKTDLVLGLAATKHQNSVIFRRVFPNLRGIIERSREIFNRPHGDYSYNESLHRWKLADGRQIEFEACQYEKDKEKQRGRPRDFYAFDEATEFTRSQIEFITAWLRTTKPGQRTRVVLPFNPPADEAGTWIIDYFSPWFAFLFPDRFHHPNPAAPGELRWYATINGRETECESGEPFEHEGETIRPLSRTFIPARLDDNPHLAETGYRSVLQSLPEPLRSQLLYGDFMAGGESDPWQVIPTAWVKAAQRRWMEMEKPNVPLSGVGVDLVRGGGDKFALSRRYGVWFDEVKTIPGVKVEDGPTAAALIHNEVKDEPYIGYMNLDIIGVGTSGYDSTKAMYPNITNGINVGAGSSYIAKSPDGQPLFRMRNLRAEIHWKMREALDPVNGRDIALPPGNEIVADLCAARYKLLAGGIGTDRQPSIQIESKDDIKKRIGRSPDVGEAIMLANFITETGPSYDTIQGLGSVNDYQSPWE